MKLIISIFNIKMIKSMIIDYILPNSPSIA